MGTLCETIDSLTERVSKSLAQTDRLTEEETKPTLVAPMLRALGWDCQSMQEVRSEHRHERGDDPVDYALMTAGQPRLFVEAKALGHDLGEHSSRRQRVIYANTAGVDSCVLTDGNRCQVCTGSAAVADDAPHLKDPPRGHPKRVIGEGVLAPADDHVLLTKDYVFTAQEREPAIPASIILGRAADGYKEWKEDQNRTLGQILGRKRTRKRRGGR
jgi:hypothetical protein